MCFIREQCTADTTFTPLANKAWFEKLAKAWGNYWILYHKRTKEALTVVCSVVKHLGSSRALKKKGDFFCAPPLPVCFTAEQSTVKASLFVNFVMVV